jgi:hypothetical protein
MGEYNTTQLSDSQALTCESHTGYKWVVIMTMISVICPGAVYIDQALCVCALLQPTIVVDQNLYGQIHMFE